MIRDLGKNNRIAVKAKQPEKINLVVKGNDNDVSLAISHSTGTAHISCEGDGNRIEIRQLRRAGSLRIKVSNGGSLFIGEKSTLEDCYILADKAKVTIGKDFMASFQTHVRTTDAHGIYSLETGELLNPPADVVIGDHVWLGQGAIVSKGSRISDNVVVAARSFVQKMKTPRNCIIGGAPARILRVGVVWDRRMTSNVFDADANIDPFLFNMLPDLKAP